MAVPGRLSLAKDPFPVLQDPGQVCLPKAFVASPAGTFVKN